MHVRFALTRSLVLLLLVAVCGCGKQGCRTSQGETMLGSAGPPNLLRQEHAGKASDIKVGAELAIELRGKPSTGYDWSYTGGGGDILISMGDPAFRVVGPEENVEQDGIYTFRFRAAKAGQATLTFRYARPWEKDGDADVLAFPIRVTP